MPRGCTRRYSCLRGCLQGPGRGGPVQLHRPKVASFHHESTNKGNCRLKTLLIMFSYFFNTSPLSTLSSLHSVLANYTCKANRKLNIPTSRDCWGSGALVKRCGGGSKVGHGTGACSPPASKALSHPQRGGAHNQALQGWGPPPHGPPELQGHECCGCAKVERAVLQEQAPLDGGTELRKDCVPRSSSSGPPAWVCKTRLFLCGSETAPSPCARVIVALDFGCLTLLLSHIQAAPKLPSKLCQTI